ncbi:signal recognition particle-docking protein FtsY [bacterium]|nr:signal recognition particle-docking protein FtsY [bacterium]
MGINEFLEIIRPLSEQYGTGDPRGDLSALLAVLLVFTGALLAFFLIRSGGNRRRSGAVAAPSGEGFDRYAGLAGKFEKLEMNANAARTELMREVEQLKSRVDHLEDVLRQLAQKTIVEEVVQDNEQSTDDDRATIEVLAPPPTEFDPLIPRETEDTDHEGTLAKGLDSSTDLSSFLEPPLPADPPPSPSVDESPEETSLSLEDKPSDQGSSAAEEESRQPTVFLGEQELAETRAEHKSPPSAPSAPSSQELSVGLSKTRSGLFRRIREVFSGKPSLSEEMVDELQAFLVSTDLGLKMVRALTEDLKAGLEKGDEVTEEHLLKKLRELVSRRLRAIASEAAPIIAERRATGPLVLFMVGVNGVGKTTTTAKLASRWKQEGAKVLLVAADTFRAAATEQLKRWGSELDIPVQAGNEGAKPGSVVYDAMQRARTEDFDVVLVDTAGRLHTKGNLMQELQGLKNIAQKHQLDAPHEVLLVVDGTTGQNALQQAKEFHSAVGLTGLIVTKLDGTSKGGIVVAVQDEYDLPVRYIGVGEAAADLKDFDGDEFVGALFDETELSELSSPSAHGKRRRRRREEQPQASEPGL